MMRGRVDEQRNVERVAREFCDISRFELFTQRSEISASYMQEMYVVEFSDLWF